MNRCEEIRGRLILYLDGEFENDEIARLEEHLAGCQSCREIVDAERRFLDEIRQAAPLHTAPPALRGRVMKVIGESPALPPASRRLRWRIRRTLHTAGTAQFPILNPWVVSTAAAITILTLPVLVWWLARSPKDSAHAPSSFATMAAETHIRHIDGRLPLEIVSDSPQHISDWFANKVRFGVKLPNYQEVSGQNKLYELQGARLVAYRDDYAAYVAYQMRTRPISLVITSD